MPSVLIKVLFPKSFPNFPKVFEKNNCIEWEITEDTTIEDLLKELNFEDCSKLILINGKHSKMNAKIKDKDKIVIFPLMTGG